MASKKSMKYDYYPQPPPNEEISRGWAKYPIPPSPVVDYSGYTVQGKDIAYADLANKSSNGFPTYPHGYQLHPPPEGVANGLATAWEPWNNSMSSRTSYAERVDNEAVVAEYWTQSELFAPGAEYEADAALIINRLHPSPGDSIPHITTQWYASEPSSYVNKTDQTYLGLSHIYHPLNGPVTPTPFYVNTPNGRVYPGTQGSATTTPVYSTATPPTYSTGYTYTGTI